MIFIDLKKAYYSLDQKRAMQIVQGTLPGLAGAIRGSGFGDRGSCFFLVRDWKCPVISSRERHFQKWQVWHIRELETLTCDYLPISFLTLINIMYLHFGIGVVVVEIITENHQYLSS